MEYKQLSTQTSCWNEHQMEVFCFSEEENPWMSACWIPLGLWILAEDIKHHYQYTKNGKTGIFTPSDSAQEVKNFS